MSPKILCGTFFEILYLYTKWLFGDNRYIVPKKIMDDPIKSSIIGLEQIHYGSSQPFPGSSQPSSSGVVSPPLSPPPSEEPLSSSSGL